MYVRPFLCWFSVQRLLYKASVVYNLNVLCILSLRGHRFGMENKSKRSNTYTTLSYWNSFSLKLVWEGICVGALSGMLVVLYRILLEKADTMREGIYAYLRVHGYVSIAAWFAILALIGIIIGVLVKKEPLISGSGIPQVKGVLLRQIKMDWLRVVVGKLIGGTLAIGAGLSLGREGPSIQLGAAAAQGFSRMLKRLKIEEKFLITSGASAGLSAAFNAPLAGVLFVLEEMHKNFSPLVLTTAMAASVTANFITQNIFGQGPIFDFHGITPLPLNYYLYIIILGVILGIFGALFNKSILKAQDMYGKQKWLPQQLRPILPLLAAGILGFVLPDVLGGGHKLIMSVSQGKFTLMVLLVLVGTKFLFTMMSYGSGAPGGIFLPLLSIGALIGCIYGNVAVRLFNLEPSFVNNFIILAMAGYFTAVVKSPVTGIVLITEMVGSFSHLLALTLVSMTSYLVTDILKSKPVYDMLFERMLKDKGKNGFSGEPGKKALLEIAVCMGSALDGKMVKNINWPVNSLLVGVKRGESEIIPKGNTLILSGDYLVVLTDEVKARTCKELMLDMAGIS